MYNIVGSSYKTLYGRNPIIRYEWIEFENFVDQKQRREQAELRKYCSGVDLTNTLRIALEHSTEFQTPLYQALILPEKEFDNIHRSAIWDIMRDYGISEELMMIMIAKLSTKANSLTGFPSQQL